MEEDIPLSIPEKRYILSKPTEMQRYLADRKKNFPNQKNLQKLRIEKQCKQQSRVLTTPTNPSKAKIQYEQVKIKNQIVARPKKLQDISLVDKILFHEHRKMDSWILESLVFIQENNFLQDKIPKEFFIDYAEKETVYEYPIPEIPEKTYFSSETSSTTSSE